jgi:ribosome-associated protein
MPLSIKNHLKKIENEARFEFVRSSGPGGQNVNKVSSKAVLHWNIEASQLFSPEQKQRLLEKLQNRINKDKDLVVSSDSFRSQDRNKHECLRRLQQWLELALFEHKKRKQTSRTARQEAKRLDSKSHQARKKQNRKQINDY